MKKSFKVSLSLFLSILIMFVSLTACGTKQEPAPSGSTAPSPSASPVGSITDGIYDGIEPLDKPINLNFGYLTGSHHGMIIYMIDRLGGYEKVGITPNVEAFGNGPVQVEAMASDSWDCGTTGLGGVLTGVITQEMLVIGAAARDYDSLRILAKNDSNIVTAGKTLSDFPNVYGTKETWAGKEVLLPTGSTLHYVLSTGLKKFGLSDSDVAMTHMDVPGVNTALRANKGEVGAMWGSFVYTEDINDKYTVVMSANDLGIELPTVMVANPRSYNDPAKKEAIKKWMELYFATVDWIYSSEENFEFAVEMFTDINEQAGATGTIDENRTVLKNNQHYSLEENYKFFNEKENNMLGIEAMHYNPLVFYINNGSYAEGDDQKLLGGYFIGDIINELHSAK
ncbi:MAG: ABC transporter substrate-binding protein [Acetivibrionales bacterium]|jgi:sulfonate transport system substrate-binding protein